MTDDIVTELHGAVERDTDPWDVTLYVRAADEIERLRAALAIAEAVIETLLKEARRG